MNGVENMLWAFLGYISMPIVLLIGYLATAFISCYLLNHFSKNKDSQSKPSSMDQA